MSPSTDLRRKYMPLSRTLLFKNLYIPAQIFKKNKTASVARKSKNQKSLKQDLSFRGGYLKRTIQVLSIKPLPQLPKGERTLHIAICPFVPPTQLMPHLKGSQSSTSSSMIAINETYSKNVSTTCLHANLIENF